MATYGHIVAKESNLSGVVIHETKILAVHCRNFSAVERIPQQQHHSNLHQKTIQERHKPDIHRFNTASQSTKHGQRPASLTAAAMMISLDITRRKHDLRFR